jgi:hypothetical protein
LRDTTTAPRTHSRTNAACGDRMSCRQIDGSCLRSRPETAATQFRPGKTRPTAESARRCRSCDAHTNRLCEVIAPPASACGPLTGMNANRNRARSDCLKAATAHLPLNETGGYSSLWPPPRYWP